MLQILLNPWVWLLLFLVLLIGAALFPLFGVIVPWILIAIQNKLGFPRNVKTGVEALLGQEAVISKPFLWDEEKSIYRGKIKIGAETWIAVSDDVDVSKLAVGELVKIEACDMLTLRVTPSRAITT